MKVPKLLISLTLLATALGSLPGRAAVVFDSTTWYAAGADTTLAVNSGTMAMAVGSGNFALTYLTPSGSYQSLSVGQSLSLTVNFSIPGTIGASASGLRFALFNSGASRISADGLGQSSTTYANYTGYTTAFGSNSLSSTSLTSSLWERSTANNALINSSSAYNTAPGTGSSGSTNTSSTPALAADTNYTMTLTLDYLSASDMKVSSLLTGGALPSGGISRSYDDATPYTSFDTVVLYSTSSMASNVNIGSATLTVVPEPSTSHAVAAALALGGLGLALRKFRRGKTTLV